MRRWEVVARLHVGCNSWIVPVSKGRRRHGSYVRAWLDARRLTKTTAEWLKDSPGPPMTWEVQRVYPRHKA